MNPASTTASHSAAGYEFLRHTIWRCPANASNGRSSISATARPGPSNGDPFKAAEAASESTRNTVYDWFKGSYNAQILQRPSPPGGALFKLKHFQRYETAPKYYEAIHQSWDPAIVDTETAAFSVCTTWGIIGRKLYLLDVLRKRLDFHKIEPAILHMKEKHNASSVVLETSGVGIAIGNALWKRSDAWSWLHPHDPKLGKVERAIAQTPKIERKRVYLPMSAPWLETFESEVATLNGRKLL